MPKPLKFALAIVLMMGADSVRSASRLMAFEGDEAKPAGDAALPHAALPPVALTSAALKTASATSPTPSPEAGVTEYDAEAERQLLELANQARAQAGVVHLTLDAGLTEAARRHAEAMMAAGDLSHQFAGEPSLVERVAAATALQLDREGENVALDYDAAEGHEHLMLSPPHRANLLNPAYNVVGMGVVRSGDRMYMVQDFGQALPGYTVAQVKEKVALAVAQARRMANQPALARRDLLLSRPVLSRPVLTRSVLTGPDLATSVPTGSAQARSALGEAAQSEAAPEAGPLDEAACSMAQADALGTSPVRQLAQRYTVLTYTSLHPEALPENAGAALASHNLRGFAVGACHAATETYPMGVYWVVVVLE